MGNQMIIDDNKKLNIFRLLRIARDIKVTDLAKILSVTPAYINAIERGERIPSDRLLRDYAQTLKVSEELILTFNKEERTSFEKTLLKILSKICDDDK